MSSTKSPSNSRNPNATPHSSYPSAGKESSSRKDDLFASSFSEGDNFKSSIPGPSPVTTKFGFARTTVAARARSRRYERTFKGIPTTYFARSDKNGDPKRPKTGDQRYRAVSTPRFSFRHGNTKSLSGFPRGTSTPPSMKARSLVATSPDSSMSSPHGEPPLSYIDDNFLESRSMVDPIEESQQYLDMDRMRMEQLRHPSWASAMSMRRSQQFALDSPLSHEFVGDDQEEDAASARELSDMGSISSYNDNMPVHSLANQLEKYRNDEKRLDSAMHRGSPVFSKAKSKGPYSLTYANLQRRDRAEAIGSDEENFVEMLSPRATMGGIPNADWVDQRINMPETWGSKAKVSPDWLSKLRDEVSKPDGSKLESFPEIDKKLEEDRLRRARENSLPSSPPSEGPSESSQHLLEGDHSQDSSLDRIQEWEDVDHDFTARSLQASQSPDIKKRSSVLEHIRDREEAYHEASDSNKVEFPDPHYQSSQNSLRMVRSIPESEAGQSKDSGTSRALSSKVSTLKPAESQRDTSSDGEDNRDDAPIDTPFMVYHTQYTSRPPSGSGRKDMSGASVKNFSLSSDALADLASQEPELGRLSEPNGATTQEKTNLLRLTNPAHAEVSSGKEGRVQDDNRERSHSDGDIILSASLKAQTTPQVGVQLQTKTPRVVGAWIDTPFSRRPEASKTELAFEPSWKTETQEQKASGVTGQNSLPVTIEANMRRRARSALEEVVNEAKRKNGGLDKDEEKVGVIGDDSIASLEELLKAGEVTLTAITSSEEDDKVNDDKGLEASKPESLRRKQLQQKLDAETLKRYNNRLRLVGLSVRDTQRGISKLEHQVSTDQKKHRNGPRQVEKESFRYSADSNSVVYRPKVWQLLLIPIPKLWTWERGRFVRPTWLGWALIVIFAWFATENALCDIYCHQMYADSIQNYGYDPHAPRMPWVTVTMIWRWTRFGVLLKPVFAIIQMILRMIDQNGSTARTTAAAGGDMVFDDDEFL